MFTDSRRICIVDLGFSDLKIAEPVASMVMVMGMGMGMGMEMEMVMVMMMVMVMEMVMVTR